jgi:hypothetical protein
METAIGYKLGEAVCRAVGLDPRRVRSLTINLDPSEPATVTAEYLIFTDDGVDSVFTQYELVERPDGD